MTAIPSPCRRTGYDDVGLRRHLRFDAIPTQSRRNPDYQNTMTDDGPLAACRAAAGLNKPDDFILALVEVNGDLATPRYVRRPFEREPDFAVTSADYRLARLLAQSEEPA